MRKRIDWKLLNENDIIVEKLDVYCDYLAEKKLTFTDEEGSHIIDLVHDIYERNTPEYKMVVDCHKKIGSFEFVTGEKCSFDIEASISKSYKDIKLKYKIDDDHKTIIVNMKEER